MDFTLTSLARIEDRPGMERLLTEYMQQMVEKLAQAGGPALSPADVLGDIWSDMDAYLPPHGRVFLATASNGRVVGCGSMRSVRLDAAELKRLYVVPAARGTGLGRRLLEARLEAARSAGWRHLYADTVSGNTPMLTLYRSAGFRPIARYPENANPPALDPYLVYLHRDLGQDRASESATRQPDEARP